LKIEICGSGVFGILLANQLSKIPEVSSNKSKITLIDKADKILANWQSLNIAGFNVSAGFHGIEMPRSSLCFSMLKDLTGEDIFEKIQNYKILFINDQVIEFGASLNDWPKNISKGLDFALKNRKEFPNNLELLKYIIGNTNIGKVINNCKERYSNNLEKSWNQFFPWFLPFDFSFDLNDEGFIFQQKVRKGIIKPYYLQPKSSHFGDLINLVENSLKNKNIEIKTNHSIELNNDLKVVKKKEDTEIIWSSSSVNLLKINQSNLYRKLTETKRYLYLILFKVSAKSFNNWLSNFRQKPSEILCMIENSIGISRISFPNQDHEKGIETDDQLILVEYISNDNNINSLEIKNVNDVLNKLFNFYNNMELLGYKLIRPIFFNAPEYCLEISKEIRKLLLKSDLRVPFIYLWPVNMAKCGYAAESASKEILSEFKKN
jgi:hypothetical protein